MEVRSRAGAAAPYAGRDVLPPDRCYLCGGPDLELRFSGHRPPGPLARTAFNCTSFGHRRHQPVWACRECGLKVQWPHPPPDELIAAYTDVKDPLYVAERRNRYMTFERVVRELGPGRGRRLLDVGAYCGYFIDVARTAGFDAEGLELSTWAADQARRLGVTVHNERLGRLVERAARYDVVTLWDVVEHLADPRQELQHVSALLPVGGRLYLSTIDASSRTARLLGRRWPWLMEMHLFYFDRRTIALLLEQAGLRMIAVRAYTHVVSAKYLLQKVGASFPSSRPVARAARALAPASWRVPVNLGDNMLVVAEKVG
jgi:2-polyprenyl-3-methyl-5-hydroxy-6-metoxy-1,4-benzoquinol methylase